MSIQVSPVLAFKDNYIWILSDTERHRCIVVDPGQARPVLQRLKTLGLSLDAIVITHHHWDHTNGIKALLDHYTVPVYGPTQEPIPSLTHPLKEGDRIALISGTIQLQVFDIPGHTRGHIAYYGHKLLFCGDTLFTGGCGRLLEGSAEEMYHSLNKLAGLPDDTLIYCGHEYTLANLCFAQFLEPNNLAITQRLEKARQLRRRYQPTVPSLLAEERLTNPFLRCALTSVVEEIQQRMNARFTSPIEAFASIRQRKNTF